MAMTSTSYWNPQDARRQQAPGAPAYAQGHYQQPQLQLESFHEQYGFEGLGAPSGPRSTLPYHEPTATTLAAQNAPRQGYAYNNGLTSQQRPNPGSTISASEGFNANFTFSSSTQLDPTLRPENVAPLEIAASSQPQTDYINAQPHHSIHPPVPKRRRDDTLEASGSGDDDEYGSEQYGATGYSYGADGFEAYPQQLVGTSFNGMSSPDMLQQHGGIRAVGQGADYGPPADGNVQLGPDGKPKQQPRAACVRCRSLKVRCETSSDPNTCRRCLNGGHDCTIPGKKKRRQPPKREHLMNQIRDQAQEKESLRQEIERLRQDLEKIGREHRPLHNVTMRSSIFSSVLADTEPARLSLSNTLLPHPGAPPAGSLTNASGAQPTQDVQEWIEKARDFITSRGGLLDDGQLLDSVEEEDQFESTEEGETDDAGTEGVQSGQETSEGEIVVEDPSGLRSPETSYRHSSPSSSTVSGSREGSHPPEMSRRRSSGRRKTPQPATASLTHNPAVPLNIIASLAAKSPKSAGSTSRGGSVDPFDASMASASPNPMSPDTNGEVKEEEGVTTSPHSKIKEGEEEAFGAVAPEYFKAKKSSIADTTHLAPARHPIPHILMKQVVAPRDVEALFRIYFDKMNVSCSLLDPVLYTAQTTYWRSPFLFTVICAVASRYYAGRPGLYEELITYAQLAAGTALISGPKNVETVSAYILLSLYPVPMRRWEEDRTWLYLGLAIRVATDLNLNQPTSVKPKNERHARELLNRTRVWLNCYNLDRSTASWHGKASTISTRDYIACHSENWYESSPHNMRDFDIQLCGYNEELRCMSEFRERIYSDPSNPTGINKNLDSIQLATETDEKLRNMEAKWETQIKQKTDPKDPQSHFRSCLLKLAHRYNRLVSLAFGFQHSFEKASADNVKSSFFARCYNASEDIISVFIDELTTQREFLRHGVEAQCVFVVFAAAFMIKLLHPKYSSYLQQEQRARIHKLVRELIDLLSCTEVVVDDKHSPKLWSRFLDGLLATPNAKVDLSANNAKEASSSSRRSTRTHNGSQTSIKSSASNPTTPNIKDSASLVSPRVTSPGTNDMLTSPDPSQASQSNPNTQVFNPSNAMFNYATQPVPSSSGSYQMISPLDQTRTQAGQGQAQAPASNEQDFMSGMYEQDAFHINANEFFRPAFPLGEDMLRSIESMDTSLWHDVPCLNWMSGLQTTETDATMQDAFMTGTIGYDLPVTNLNF